jgi:hypothetical protein
MERAVLLFPQKLWLVLEVSEVIIEINGWIPVAVLLLSWDALGVIACEADWP